MLELHHQIILSYYYPRKVPHRRHSLAPHLLAGVPARIEVGEGEAFGFGPPGNGGCSLGIEVRPGRVLFAGQVGAFGNEQVGVRRQEHGILADASVRAVGDDLAVQIEAIAHTGRGVHQETAVESKGQLVGARGKLAKLHRVGQPIQGDGEGLVDNSIQCRSGALLAEDGEAGETEFAEDVQPLDVVQVEVAQKEVDGQLVLDVAVRFVKAVSGIEDDVVLVGVDEGADGVTGGAVVPAVGAEKDDLHANSPQPTRPASGGLFRL